MQIGQVLSKGWELYKRFLWQFFLTAVVVFAVLDLLSALADTAAGEPPASSPRSLLGSASCSWSSQASSC